MTEDLSRPVSNVHNDVHVDDTASEAVTKVLDASIRSLIDMRSMTSELPVDAAVAAFKDARQIAFAGLGASGHVAADACQKFFRLGIPCTALTNTPDVLQYSGIAEPTDVLVIAIVQRQLARTRARSGTRCCSLRYGDCTDAPRFETCRGGNDPVSIRVH